MSADTWDDEDGYYIKFEGDVVQVASTVKSLLCLFGMQGAKHYKASCG